MSALPVRLRAMLIDEKYTDCSFLVQNDTCIHGHKIILAASSPVFEAMFYGPLATQQEDTQRPIAIVDVSAKIFRAMLDYVYTDEVDWNTLTHYDLLELYYCAEKYLIRRDDILNHIRESLNCNSLYLLYDFAIRFKLSLLLTDCRHLLSELLDKKPNLFFKKVLQVNCDLVIRAYEDEEDDECHSAGEECGPAVKRKPPLPIEFIEDIVFGATDEPIGQYHQVSKECLNDMLLLNCDAENGLFSENLLLFVLKWTKIEWKLESKGHEKLPLQKIPLLGFYNTFVCRKRTDALVENLISFLENHFYLNNVTSVSGWHLMQRVDLKASPPLTISSGAATSFDTVFQVNHLVTIKSLIIKSRLNNAILSRFMRSTATPQQFVYKENVSLEIFSSDTEGRGLITIHRQRFGTETEFNAQCELFLNRCLFFHPDQIYTLRFHWPKDLALMTIEYPRQIFERCHRLIMTDKQLSIVFVDDASSSSVNREVDLIAGGILCGLQFMFVS